ncbi:MAG: LPS export ABC transporter permease LptF [Hyphomicrobiales bacterium]|nr:MAG: LPS export ABC transporter permease LptF [Hyphomicrobiales bacterium]
MGILSRYIFRQTAGVLLLVTLSLTGMVWIGVALRQLEVLTSQGQNIGRFLLITLLALPTMMTLIAPIALLLASIHVLHKLSGDSELIVMTAGGMPAWALLKPLATLALLVALAVGLVNHVVGPWSQVKLRDMANEIRTDLMSFVLQPWRFTTPEEKLTLHIRDRSPTGELLGLMMHDARDATQVVTYLADRGLIIKQGTQAYLRMDKGHILRKVPDQPAPQIITFDSHIVDLNQLEQRVEQAPVARPRERPTYELWTLDPTDPKEAPQAKKALGELHERLVSPLYALVFVLVVVAHMGQAQTVRQNHTQAGIGAFGLAIGARVAGIAAGNAVTGKGNAVPYVYLIPAVAILLALFAIYWHAYPRAPSRLQRGLIAFNAALKERISGLFTRAPLPAGRSG